MYIKISDFHMIKSATIQLDGLTVIAGENNTGKSTIGKLIFSIIKAHNITRDRQKLGRQTSEWSSLRKLFTLVFETDQIKKAEVTIGHEQQEVYKMSADEQGRIDVTGSLGKFRLYDATYIESPVVWSLIDFFTTVDFMRDEEKMLGDTRDEVKYPYLLWDTYKKVSGPPKRINNHNEQEYQKLLEAIREMVGGQIQTTFRNFTFQRDADQAVFPVTNIATGIKSFGLLQMLIEKRRINSNTILIIDEPEVHLHPKWELDFAKVIAALVRLGVRVVVTTHSMYMVRALREYTKNEPEKVRFYLAESQDDLQSVYEDVTLDTQRIYKKFADPLSQLVWGKIDV